MQLEKKKKKEQKKKKTYLRIVKIGYPGMT